jgi:hypothetical protein
MDGFRGLGGLVPPSCEWHPYLNQSTRDKEVGIRFVVCTCCACRHTLKSWGLDVPSASFDIGVVASFGYMLVSLGLGEGRGGRRGGAREGFWYLLSAHDFTFTCCRNVDSYCVDMLPLFLARHPSRTGDTA